MSKFKKGDRVVTKAGNHGVISEVMGPPFYAVWIDGRQYPDKLEEFRLTPERGRASNAAVVANAVNEARAENATMEKIDIPHAKRNILAKEKEVRDHIYNVDRVSYSLQKSIYSLIDYVSRLPKLDDEGERYKVHVNRMMHHFDAIASGVYELAQIDKLFTKR